MSNTEHDRTKCPNCEKCIADLREENAKLRQLAKDALQEVRDIKVVTVPLLMLWKIKRQLPASALDAVCNNPTFKAELDSPTVQDKIHQTAASIQLQEMPNTPSQ